MMVPHLFYTQDGMDGFAECRKGSWYHSLPLVPHGRLSPPKLLHSFKGTTYSSVPLSTQLPQSHCFTVPRQEQSGMPT